MLAQSVNDYVPIFILIAVALGIALSILVLTHLVGPRRIGHVKHDTYESGMDPVGDTRRRFSVRFYMVAVLFLIFDVEIIFLYPWAVLTPRLREAAGTDAAWAEAMRSAGYTPGFLLAAIGIFFALLLVGFVYEWRRGVFKWN
jgi:NADH-quinone oxidoreductase subunit A